MAKSSDAVPFETDDEQNVTEVADNTCPECGTDSVALYADRYSSYEYCTNCDWSDEEDADTGSVEPINRRDREREYG